MRKSENSIDIQEDYFINRISKEFRKVKSRICLDNPAILKKVLETENVLGVVEFNHGNKSSISQVIPAHLPYLQVRMDPYQGQSVAEIWTSSHNVIYGKVDHFTFAADGENMFACTSCKQKNESLAEIAEESYNELFKLISTLHHPYLYRMWNYVSRINEDDVNHMERYKSFSYGRAISFLKNNPVPENLRFPAATGIGSLAGDLDIYFLASSLPRYIHLENPRQVSAYHYPKQYGPKSPSFARATYYKRGKEIFNMYISGTASVRGYETVHKNDIEKQCQTTFGNIEALISQDNLNKYGVTVPVTINATDNVKVYIRNYEDFPIVKKMCDEFFSSTDSILYLKADICRDDLVVEIEGSYLMNLGLRQI